jgi:hypothetical protein
MDEHDSIERDPVEIDPVEVDPIDLDRIDRDLVGVEAALARLDDGTYWTDEITGEPLDAQLLADGPVARRNSSHTV